MTGVTNASFNADGKCPAATDRLKERKERPISLATCFNTDTGSGSVAELLSGSFMIPAITSPTDIVENDYRDMPGLTAVNVGSGVSAVPDLMATTFFTENLLKSSTVIAELAGSRPHPSSISTDHQSRRGDARSASFVSHQNALHLASQSSRYRQR